MSYRYLTEYQTEVVHAWRKALDPEESHAAESAGPARIEGVGSIRPFRFDRGHRARLRRATSLAELETESSCFELRERLGALRSIWLDDRDAEWLFLVAGAVARVDDCREDRSLALALGCSSAKDGKPPMSELRFRRLLQESDPEAFFRQLRRALDLASGKVNAAQLAADLLAWVAERNSPRSSAHSVRYRWARDYFLDRKELKNSKQNHAALVAANSPAATQEETSA